MLPVHRPSPLYHSCRLSRSVKRQQLFENHFQADRLQHTSSPHGDVPLGLQPKSKEGHLETHQSRNITAGLQRTDRLRQMAYPKFNW